MRHQTTFWLWIVTIKLVWKKLRLFWIDICLASLNIVIHNAGKPFVAKVFEINAKLLHFESMCETMELPNFMRYMWHCQP